MRNLICVNLNSDTIVALVSTVIKLMIFGGMGVAVICLLFNFARRKRLLYFGLGVAIAGILLYLVLNPVFNYCLELYLRRPV